MPYTNNLRLYYPLSAECNYGYGWHDSERIKDIVINQILKGNRVVSGGEISNFTAFGFDVSNIICEVDSLQFIISEFSVEVDPAVTEIFRAHYLYIDKYGDVKLSTTISQDSQMIALYVILVSESEIEYIGDLRHFSYKQDVQVEIYENLFLNPKFLNWPQSKSLHLSNFGENVYSAATWRSIGVACDVKFATISHIPHFEMITTSANLREFTIYQSFRKTNEWSDFLGYNDVSKKFCEFEVWIPDIDDDPIIAVESVFSNYDGLQYPDYSAFHAGPREIPDIYNDVIIEIVDGSIVKNAWNKIRAYINEDITNIDFPIPDLGSGKIVYPKYYCYQHILIGIRYDEGSTVPSGTVIRIRNPILTSTEEFKKLVTKSNIKQKIDNESKNISTDIIVIQKESSSTSIKGINYRLPGIFPGNSNLSVNWNDGLGVGTSGYVDYDSVGVVPTNINFGTTVSGQSNEEDSCICINSIDFDGTVPKNSRFKIPIIIALR